MPSDNAGRKKCVTGILVEQKVEGSRSLVGMLDSSNLLTKTRSNSKTLLVLWT